MKKFLFIVISSLIICSAALAKKNFSNIKFVFTLLLLILLTALNLADLEGGFSSISFNEGIIGFLLIRLK